MMTRKIYIDTEFHERVIPYHGHDLPIVELISIGMVDSAGKTYSAVSKEFNLKAAQKNPWLAANVLPKLSPRKEWKSRKEIREDILEFVGTQAVQIVYWYIPHDALLLSQIMATNLMMVPRNMRGIPHNLAQEVQDLNAPASVLPQVDPTVEHSALADAQWLKAADEAMMVYRRSQYFRDTYSHPCI